MAPIGASYLKPRGQDGFYEPCYRAKFFEELLVAEIISQTPQPINIVCPVDLFNSGFLW